MPTHEGPRGSNASWNALATSAHLESLLPTSSPSRELDGARIHDGAAAAEIAGAAEASALTVGHDVYLGASESNGSGSSPLLRHELAHVRQAEAGGAPAYAPGKPVEPVADDDPRERQAEQVAHGLAPMPPRRAQLGDGGAGPVPAFRRPVQTSTIQRQTAADIFGIVAPIPRPGMTLAELQDYTQRQADWFVEPTLSATDRRDIWRLLLLLAEGDHIRSGMGDLRVAALRSLSAPDLQALRDFSRTTDSSQHTIRTYNTRAYTQARRIALGRTLVELEALISPALLELTVSQSQLEHVNTNSLMPALRLYWSTFSPMLHRPYESTQAGGQGVEFQRLLDLLATIGGQAGIPGIAPLAPWVRNPHRFSYAALVQLLFNITDTTGTRQLVVVVFTAHDTESYQAQTGLYDSLILTSGHNVLLIEGAATLQSVITRIPTIASTYGRRDAGGVRRINQAILAGHGNPQSVTLAGTGGLSVSGGAISYTQEALDVANNRAQTQTFLDTLFTNMDRSTARLLFDACLVGATQVPAGTSAANIPGQVTAAQSIGSFARDRAAAAGIARNRVMAARASTGQASSIFDPATGNVRIHFPNDPHAYGTAETYARQGNEPEGVLRAAVEVGATTTRAYSPPMTNPVYAESLLRPRLSPAARTAAAASGWWRECTRVLVEVALSTVASGAALDLQRTNELAAIASTVFVSRWPASFHMNADALAGTLNTGPFAADIYRLVTGTQTYAAPPDADARRFRMVIDQAWLARSRTAGRRAALMASITASGFRANALAPWISHTILRRHLRHLLPRAGSPTAAQRRLALAWFARDTRNRTVRSFLTAQLDPTSTTPRFDAAMRAEISAARQDQNGILRRLNLLSTAPSPGGSSSSRTRRRRDVANVDAYPSTRNLNETYVRVSPHEAEVIRCYYLSVRPRPNLSRRAFAKLSRGQVVRVMGRARGWAAIDYKGRLGFAYAYYLRRR